MTYVLRIPALSQGYLQLVHDAVQDKHDVIDWKVPYGNEVSVDLTTNLVGYWKMEEDGAAARADSSGNGRDLALSGVATIPKATGMLGDCADAYNTADLGYYFIVSGESIDLSGGWTFAVWAKHVRGAATAGSALMGIYCDAGAYYDQSHVKINVSGTTTTVTAERLYGAEETEADTTIATDPSEDWHLYILTWDPEDGSFGDQIDDSAPQSTAGPATWPTACDEVSMWIQQRGSSLLIDDTYLFNKCLSAAEISALYNGGNGTDLS